MASRIAFLFRLLCVALFAAAITSGVSAHRTVVPDDLAAFYASGGTVADLCSDSGAMDPAGDRGCDACRLVAGAGLPPVPDAFGPAEMPVVMAMVAVDAAPIPERAAFSQPLSRGPPQS